MSDLLIVILCYSAIKRICIGIISLWILNKWSWKHVKL